MLNKDQLLHINKINNRQLLKLIEHVRKKIPFYYEKNIMDFSNVNDDSLVHYFIDQFPIIDKESIKKNIRSFIDKRLNDENINEILNFNKDYKKEYEYSTNLGTIYTEYTSGTNGTPFMCLKTQNERVHIGYSLCCLRRRFFEHQPDKMFMFVHKYGEKNYPFPFEKEVVKEERTRKELKYLSEKDFTWWHMTSFQMDHYYRYLIDHKFEFPSLKVIENNGSFISEEEKKLFGGIFKAKIANNYGCREVWTIAYDCPCGHLHINSDRIIFELVDEDGDVIVEPNKIGYVVVTSLDQYSMPFIRYRIGDMAYYEEGNCECGYSSRRIVLIPGRSLVKGTNNYGNVIFRKVVRQLVWKGITDFGTIHVIQTDLNEFEVNICENNVEKDLIESKFIKYANKYLNSENKFLFTYNDNSNYKSIFDVSKKFKNVTKS